uniref:Uncharacterized protein n=1 Tax=Anguilla anguilla TaxID=7936 RepID=A0A0E9XBJ3_ANGAN
MVNPEICNFTFTERKSSCLFRDGVGAISATRFCKSSLLWPTWA